MKLGSSREHVAPRRGGEVRGGEVRGGEVSEVSEEEDEEEEEEEEAEEEDDEEEEEPEDTFTFRWRFLLFGEGSPDESAAGDDEMELDDEGLTAGTTASLCIEFNIPGCLWSFKQSS